MKVALSRERVVLLGSTKSLVGIITDPEDDGERPARPGVILLNAGLIHRVGPNRVYVRLARNLAAQGFVVLRFDPSGTGDSGVRADHLPVEKSAVEEIREAMVHLTETRGVDRFVLIGHCSGAVMSFRTACQDSRVVGAVMINAEGVDDDWTAYDRQRKTGRYHQRLYRNSLFESRKWAKLLSGKADYQSILRVLFRNIFWNKILALRFKIRMALTPRRRAASLRPELVSIPSDFRSLVQRDVQALLVYSEGSTGLEYIKALLGETLNELLESGKLHLEIIPEADHTFTLLENQARLIQVIGNWIRQDWSSSMPSAPPAAPSGS